MIAGPDELEPVQPIRTERLLLRPFTPEELEAVVDGALLREFAPGFPTAQDRDWAAEALEAGCHFFTETRYAMFAVVDMASERIVGTAGFAGPPLDGELEIVAMLVPGRRRQGLAREALPEILRLAFEDPAVNAVCAYVPPGNVATEKFLLAHGFVPRGTPDALETSFVYSRR